MTTPFLCGWCVKLANVLKACLLSELPNAPTLTPFHALQLSGAGLDSSNWCGAHPDVAAHALLAPQLEKFIRSILPSWQ